MAMDYGDGAAPNPSGEMGTFAIDAATAMDAQVAAAMGISDAAAWSKVAVTPMIGVNDTSDEIFTVANAQQLVALAASKHLALAVDVVGRPRPGVRGRRAELPRANLQRHRADAGCVHGRVRRVLARRPC